MRMKKKKKVNKFIHALPRHVKRKCETERTVNRPRFDGGERKKKVFQVREAGERIYRVLSTDCFSSSATATATAAPKIALSGASSSLIDGLVVSTTSGLLFVSRASMSR